MSQIALPLPPGGLEPPRIVLGPANAAVAEALRAPAAWPYGTAVLTGPPRSGKSLLARWFARTGEGAPPREALDDAHLEDETVLFHRWNRAQEEGTRLLLVAGEPPWRIRLPDLASRLGAALQLEIGAPDDAMAGELILTHAAARGVALGEEAAAYLVPRAGRSFAEIERLVAMIDTLSLERKAAPTLGIWRAALEALYGPDEPRLL
jgi:hypothetical protein